MEKSVFKITMRKDDEHPEDWKNEVSGYLSIMDGIEIGFDRRGNDVNSEKVWFATVIENGLAVVHNAPTRKAAVSKVQELLPRIKSILTGKLDLIAITDNNSETMDRYTAYFTDNYMLMMSENCLSPQGVCLSDTSKPEYLANDHGKRMRILDCPKDVQKAIVDFMN